MIMRDMDRASTMNPTMVDMRNMRHWVDRSVWTETLGAAGAVAIARRGRVTAHLITTITTSDDGKAIFTRSFDQATVRAEAAEGRCAPLTNVPTTVDIEAKPPPFQTSIQPSPAGHHEQ